MKIDRKTLRRALRHARQLEAILTELLADDAEPETEPGADAAPAAGQIAPGTTEAESLTLSGGYVVEEVTHPAIESGRVIRTTGAGVCEGVFTGPNGLYRIEVLYFDEADGQARFDLQVDGKTLLTWTANKDDEALHGVMAVATFGPGALISIRSASDAGEPARIDRIVVTAIPENTPDTIITEKREPVTEQGEPVTKDQI